MKDDCWIWAKAIDRCGYGRISFNGRNDMAHRVIYESLKADIPQGMQLDHLCRTPSCVNPDHLEPVTQAENLLRSPISNSGKTHCKWGHKFTEGNILVRKDRFARICRKCLKRRNKERLLRGELSVC